MVSKVIGEKSSYSKKIVDNSSRVLDPTPKEIHRTEVKQKATG